MKKIILLLLIFSLIPSLFSCTTPPETPPTSEEIEVTIEPEYTDESPFDFVLTSLNSRLYKVYPEEGIIMPACSDPLCKHKDISCPFTKTSAIRTYGNLLYYTRYNADQRCAFKICSYDFSTDEYSLLYEVDKNEHITYLHVSDKYLYFNVLSDWKKGNENSAIRLMRYELENGEVKVLEDKLPDYTYVLCEEEGRLYWRNGTGYFSTDLDYQNKKENDKGYSPGNVTGGYAIESIKTGNILGTSGAKFPEREILKVDLKTRKKSVLIESTGTHPMLYNGKVIYTRDEKAVFIGETYDNIDGKGIKIYAKLGNKLYIRNIDGSEDRLLCDFTGNNLMIQVSGAAGSYYYGKGDYIVYRVWYYEPVKGKPEYIQQGDDRLLVINIVTGEYKILSAE